MYAFPEMITELGLKEGEHFPTSAHQVVAEKICLGNPNIDNRDRLQSAVSSILSVPIDRIETVTYNELIEEFEFGY